MEGLDEDILALAADSKFICALPLIDMLYSEKPNDMT